MKNGYAIAVACLTLATHILTNICHNNLHDEACDDACQPHYTETGDYDSEPESSYTWFEANINSYYKSNVKLGHININGIYNKMEEVLVMLNKKMFDILFISETKIGDATSDSLLNQPNYRLLRRDLKKGAGGLMRMYVQTYQYTGDESSNLK